MKLLPASERERVIGVRRDKHNYYLDTAQTVLERSTCLRRHFGAVIVKNDEIVSTGYNGAPRGRANCSDLNYCIRKKLNIPRGEHYEICRSVHAEANAIISAPRYEMLNSTLYLVCKDAETDELMPGTMPCTMCKRLIINAGIKTVIVRDTLEDYTIVDVQRDWIDGDETLKGVFNY